MSLYNWLPTVKAVWLLENNVLDDTTNGFTSIAYLTPTYSSVIKHNDTYSINFTNSYTGALITPQNLMNLIYADAVGYSYECWVYDSKVSGDNHVGGSIAISSLLGTYFYRFVIGDNGVNFKWNNSDNIISAYTRATEKNTWIHWAWTYDVVNNRFKVYKNGNLIFTKNTAGNCFTVTNNGICTGTDGNDPSTCYIDNIIINVGIVPTSFPTLPISVPTVTDCTSPVYTTGGETITVNGTDFRAGAVVSIDGVDLTTVFVSSTELTATTQATAAGAYDVTVTNTDTGTATLTNGITYINLATTLTNISPANSATQGGGVMTITGTGFTNTSVIYIDGLAVTTTYISATILQCIIPAHAAGGVTIQIIDGENVLTWDYNFIYIVGAPEDYTVLINGKDVTGVQIKRFTQKNEINFIDRTNLSFNNIEITAPFNIINLFYKDNNNDIVTVRRNAVALFKGYISAKEKDYSTQIYYITASQLLSLTGKTNAVLADGSGSAPVARVINLLTDYLPIEYTAPQATGLDSYFAGISILLNTGTNDAKLLDVILSICELLDLAIFIDNNLTIKIIPLPLAFSNGKDITEALASLPVIKEKKEYYYNAVSLKYYATVGGAEATATAGSGDLALNLSFSNIYFDAASAALIAARKLALRNKIYFEAEFTVNKTVTLNIGDSFAFDIYNFICLYKEETLTSFKIRGLGAEK